MQLGKRDLGLRRFARQWAERIDDAYARVVHVRRFTGAPKRVLVTGIYRDPEPIASVVDELRRSRHDVIVRLGAMGAVPDRLSAWTAQGHMTEGKFQNLNALVGDHGTPDWLVIIDDDVTLPARFLDEAIELCERLDFALAQPAQTRQSNANWQVAKRRLLTVARESAFVEIGPVTIIRADAQRILLPFPQDLRYGWGLDFHWARLLEDARLRRGILDLVAVTHAARKVASTYSWDAAQEEGRAFLARVPHLPPAIAAGSGGTRYRLPPRPRG